MIVQGDTVTCFAASLAAFYACIPVCHVEAGLRTYDLSAPFPEEGMRQLVTRLATLHFAATEGNAANLLREGVPDEAIFVTGNTVIDALFTAREKVLTAGGSAILKELPGDARLKIESAERTVLITGHRRESFGKGLTNICEALLACAQLYGNILFIYPVHPNPAVQGEVHARLGKQANILLLPPLDYPTFVYLMQSACLIVTDSGGIQEEAPALGKPVIVTRNETERQEALETGQVILAGTTQEKIVEAICSLLSDAERCTRMASHGSPYGDGRAADRIVSRIIDRIKPPQQDTCLAL